MLKKRSGASSKMKLLKKLKRTTTRLSMEKSSSSTPKTGRPSKHKLAKKLKLKKDTKKKKKGRVLRRKSDDDESLSTPETSSEEGEEEEEEENEVENELSDDEDDDRVYSLGNTSALSKGRKKRTEKKPTVHKRIRRIIESSSSSHESSEEVVDVVDDEKIVADMSHQQQQQLQQSVCVSQREIDLVRPNGRTVKVDCFEKVAFICELEPGVEPLELPVCRPIDNAPPVTLPKVEVTTDLDYLIGMDQFTDTLNCVKYTEKTNEEMDEHLEYDMDEEDMIWLEDVNEKRVEIGLDSIEQNKFVLLMDRLEKESYFQSSLSSRPSLNTSRASQNENANEDALCCICLDGECVNSNVILFCDMCNLAVHQECYGVPYIPEGQWLCRRCIQSPSTPVQCILCPNHKTGAYKQTDRGEWVHVVCAIWIPEVHFANTVFLEPVIGVEHIDRARFKLMCFICRRRGVGACIQCDKQNCYTAFHVTCAQQAGLYMNIQEEYDTTPNTSTANHNTPAQLVDVKKCAYCDAHTPRDSLSPRTRADLLKSGLAEHELTSDEALKRAQKIRMKRTRKLLAEKRNAPPVLSVPCIPTERLEEIQRRVFAGSTQSGVDEFMRKLMDYWLFKRYARNGRPLLRRLQMSAIVKKGGASGGGALPVTATASSATLNTSTSSSPSKKEEVTPSKKEALKRLREERDELRVLRIQFEKARILLETMLKREKTKRELYLLEQQSSKYELNPFNGVFLQGLMNRLFELDTNGYFWLPVDPVHVPTYYNVIKNPMDMETMQNKISALKYNTFEEFEADFNLIISNCYRFNPKSSPFYKAAVKLKEQALPMLKKAKKVNSMENQSLSELNIDTTSSLPSTSQPVTATSIATTATTISNIIEKEIETNENVNVNVNVSTPPVERPTRRRSSSSDHHLHSTPIKTRSSLVLASKLEQIEDEADSNRTKTAADDSSASNQDTTSENLLMVATSSSSTTVSDNNSASGVNRRTAVLFKRNKKHK